MVGRNRKNIGFFGARKKTKRIQICNQRRVHNNTKLNSGL